MRAFALKRFWPKLAQVEYDLGKIEESARHLTNIAVSNEREQPWFTDFISHVENEHKINWEEQVQKPSLRAIRCILEAVAVKSPPEGIAQNGHSRAMYGVDIMLEQTDNGEICPKILEFNFNSDCSRVSELCPEFYEEILAATYLEKLDDIQYFDLNMF